MPLKKPKMLIFLSLKNKNTMERVNNQAVIKTAIIKNLKICVHCSTLYFFYPFFISAKVKGVHHLFNPVHHFFDFYGLMHENR